MVLCLILVAFTKVSYGRGPSKLLLGKGSARSSVYSKNRFQHRNTLSSPVAGVEQPAQYVALGQELL